MKVFVRHLTEYFRWKLKLRRKNNTKYLQASCFYEQEAEKERIKTKFLEQLKVLALSNTHFRLAT